MATGTRTTRGIGRQTFGSVILWEHDFEPGTALGTTDSVDTNVNVRRFDDTVDENIGCLYLYVPEGATGFDMTFVHRAQTSQTGAQTVQQQFTTVPDTGDVTAGSVEFTVDITIPDSDTTWQYETFSIDLSSTSFIAGEPGQFAMEMDASDSTITGDWVFRMMLIEFY